MAGEAESIRGGHFFGFVDDHHVAFRLSSADD
jgi:hypothetical protein